MLKCCKNVLFTVDIIFCEIGKSFSYSGFVTFHFFIRFVRIIITITPFKTTGIIHWVIIFSGMGIVHIQTLCNFIIAIFNVVWFTRITTTYLSNFTLEIFRYWKTSCILIDILILTCMAQKLIAVQLVHNDSEFNNFFFFL